MKNDLRDKLSTAATVIEILLGVIILIYCVICGCGILFSTDVYRLFTIPVYLQTRLSDACLIIIGVELIKMITSYSIDSVVDVMLLAVARQMIVEHTSPKENVMAVVAVGLLFVIRKYLYISNLDRPRQSKREIEEAVRAEVFSENNIPK